MIGVKDQHGVFIEDLPKEIWRTAILEDIDPRLHKYINNQLQVSNLGRLRKKVRKGWKQQYNIAHFRKSLLVASVWSKGLRTKALKHLDGDKYNCKADNLVWI